MKTIGIILVAAVAYFVTAVAFSHFIYDDVLTQRDLVKTAVSAVVFVAIFVPIMVRMAKNKKVK